MEWLFVSTAIEESWGELEPVLFLGETHSVLGIMVSSLLATPQVGGT
ncbi:MAG: hypothetical protein QF419_07625 [Acidimicrobiales bacterium]|nr:hypothetical protein [Acidimicrobiales bacterium]